MCAIAAYKRWSRRKSARPAELTAAALELFVERGYAATRLEDVARRAGVSKATLYLYFDGKDALFKSVVREGIVSALECGERMAAEHTGSARVLLEELLLGWWQLIGSRQIGGIPKLMLSECGNFPELGRFYFDEVICRGHRLIAAALRRGMDDGEFRIMDVELVARLIWAPQVLLGLWQHSFDQYDAAPADPQRYIHQHLDLLLRGLLQHADVPPAVRAGPPRHERNSDTRIKHEKQRVLGGR